MNGMKSRAISLILLLGLFTGIFASCSKGSTDEKNLNLSVNFDGMVFKADTINTAIKGNEIAVYTRDYRDNTGSYQLRIGGSHTDRAVVSVKYSNTVEFGIEYTVISVDTTTNNKSNTPIPVNGFVISLPLEKVSGLKIKKDKEIEVFGFEQIASEYERFDLCTFIPEDKTLTRRVYYVNPVDGINENSNITLLTSKYSVDTELPPGSVAFILRLVATANYRISSIQEGGTIAKGTNALVFIGEYNTMYAKSLFKENVKMYISREERASSYSDISAVVIGEEVYKIGEERTNLESITESGLYFYNSYHTELVTPAREIDFYDVVVVDDIVVYKGAKNTRILIPSNNGVVVAFTGEKAVLAESLSIGDKITTIIVKTRNLPEKYISVNKYIFELNSTNASRSTNNPCVLYTPEYGEATGTDNDGTEIIISDNKVTSVLYARGDTKIPENGYVLSIHNSSTSYKHADKIETGMKCLISLSNSVYSITELDYDGINTVRTSDSLIVYKGVQSTGTNAYGYEVLVSGDGLIIGESTSGNSKIPGGGLVLSGHGKSAKLLSNLYVNGANIILNEVDRSVKIIKSPTLNIQNALNAYENAVKLFEEAKKQFYDIDYTEVQNTLNEISELTEQIGIAINSTDYPEAIRLSEIVKESIDTLGYSMIRSSAVENRAAWYRSYDKSDSEVRAAIEKAAALNINAIYLETWYNGMVIGYSDNKLISHNKTAHGDFDALESFCRIGHEYGIEIHAWVENFFIGTLSYAEANPDSLVSNTVGKHLLDSQGNNYNKTIFGDYVFLNPYDKENRSLVLNIYKEIIENYDIDGIHLDYI
ncbi:MAG TPA: hypothetical protein DD733_02780, partial [Clostridiales bacterium]|nr:hypothetical protein [Clostridiales bacterium]